MIVTRELSALPPIAPGGSVVSIGVFDGMHLGHQAILAANVERARGLGARPTVVTFRQHPKQVLLGRSPKTLTTLEHRLELFRRAGVEHTLALAFDEDLRDTPAEEFLQRILLEGLGARSFVLGFDSKFGRDREGTPERIAALGQDVLVVPGVFVDGRAVSSTAIREAVELGDLEAAARMLGRRFSVFGEVVAGRALGRRLGFPTANLDLRHELHPPPGVYAGLAHRVAPGRRSEVRSSHAAVCNIGFRPTVAGERPDEATVEAHLLDFERDLYGEHLELEFVRVLREERRFESVEALAEQIARDVETARALLAELPDTPREGAGAAPPPGRTSGRSA